MKTTNSMTAQIPFATISSITSCLPCRTPANSCETCPREPFPAMSREPVDDALPISRTSVKQSFSSARWWPELVGSVLVAGIFAGAFDLSKPESKIISATTYARGHIVGLNKPAPQNPVAAQTTRHKNAPKPL